MKEFNPCLQSMHVCLCVRVAPPSSPAVNGALSPSPEPSPPQTPSPPPQTPSPPPKTPTKTPDATKKALPLPTPEESEAPTAPARLNDDKANQETANNNVEDKEAKKVDELYDIPVGKLPYDQLKG